MAENTGIALGAQAGQNAFNAPQDTSQLDILQQAVVNNNATLVYISSRLQELVNRLDGTGDSCEGNTGPAPAPSGALARLDEAIRNNADRAAEISALVSRLETLA